MITGFCLVPSDNLPPKTPIPVQPSAGVPRPSLLSCFYLGWYPTLSLFHDLCALHPDHNTKPSRLPLIQSRRHLLRVKFPLPIYIGDTGTQQAFQSFSKASISKLCRSTSHPVSWVLTLPLHAKECAILQMLHFCSCTTITRTQLGKCCTSLCGLSGYVVTHHIPTCIFPK